MGSPLAILIVDDHPGMCATLQDILENEGYEAHVALTGAEAIAQCQARRFDVILMDVLMPDLCGVEVYRRIKTLAPDTRVIMMSAYSVKPGAALTVLDEVADKASGRQAVAFWKFYVRVLLRNSDALDTFDDSAAQKAETALARVELHDPNDSDLPNLRAAIYERDRRRLRSRRR